jgi:galactokinase
MEKGIHTKLLQSAQKHSLDISGGRVRRSSSRFCFGVEHGDYNGTKLFGVGTDRFIWLAFKPNQLGRVRIFSENFPEDGVVDIALDKSPNPETLADNWSRFPNGVSFILNREGYKLTTGFDAVLYGNIPGGGMSRSASLALNLIETFLEVNDASKVEGMRIVDLAQMVETDYIGSPCGKLDQIMIYFAKAGMGTYYDPVCETIEHIPFGGETETFRIVSMDTGSKRPGLEKSTYKIRRNECDDLANSLSGLMDIKLLGEINTPELYERAKALIKENQLSGSRLLKYLYEAQTRFDATLEAWRAGDIKAVGHNFRADGIGLRDDYRISGKELETMCEIARTVHGVYGERMLGGGDKGASGALIEATAFDALTTAINRNYPFLCPDYADLYAVHSCSIVDGLTCSPLQC